MSPYRQPKFRGAYHLLIIFAVPLLVFTVFFFRSLPATALVINLVLVAYMLLTRKA